MGDFRDLRIQEDRFKADFEALATFGSTGDGGVNRPSLSAAHLEARAWLKEQIEASGLEFSMDSAGNHSGLYRSAIAEAPHLLMGSHTDSVPNGGRFDGALGVLAALEAARVAQEASLRLPYTLEMIDFTDEEGTLVGLFGSSAVGGKLSEKGLLAPRGGRAALEEGLARAGLVENEIFQAVRPAETLAGYLEVHVEQGSRLIESNTDIGVVSAIVGIISYALTFQGRADHAGTTGMDARLDAAQGAAAFTLAARELTMADFPDCVANVGQMRFTPGAFNIVPEAVETWLELRAPTREKLNALEAALLQAAEEAADEFGLGLTVEFRGKMQPAPMAERARGAFAAACETLGLSHTALPSGAGHDAQALAGLCPVGMIFIPSSGGSHNPNEFAEWRACVNGANLLLQAALEMCLGES
jgi:N-carbamoyl-L-amino-acid hydrolase